MISQIAIPTPLLCTTANRGDSLNQTLLTLLADGQFHSGSDLAKCCGVTRAAIWKHIKGLGELGIQINSIRGRGYRIPGGLDLLDVQTLNKHFASSNLTPTLLSTTESTNRDVQRFIAEGVKYPLVVSEYQTGGKGRRGRTWVSPYAANLYFSLGWPFSGGVAALEGLSLAVGLAVHDALRSLGVEGVSLKWPNDILLNGRKLAGILIEIGGDLSGDCAAVIGIGLNVNMPVDSASAIDQPWTDLSELRAKGVSRSEILSTVVNQLTDMLAEFELKGFAPLVNRWESANAYQNEVVRLIIGDKEILGSCSGVDASGALRLLTEAGEQVFQGGEVSLRGVSNAS